MVRNKKLTKDPGKNQKRITQFFIKQQPSGSGSTASSQSTPSSSVATTPATATPTLFNRRPPARPRWVDDGDYSEIEVLPPPTPPPKIVVDLLSSGEESGSEDNSNQAKSVKIKEEAPSLDNSTVESAQEDQDQSAADPVQGPSKPTSPSGENSNGAFSSSGDEILSQKDVDEIIRSSQGSGKSPSYSPFNENSNSSGDEVLSQIDIDEVIRSSQSSLSSHENEDKEDRQSPSLLCSTPNKENFDFRRPHSQQSNSQEPAFKSPPPKISPKSQLTKFSPRRHMRVKRTSSEASLDGTSTDARSSRGNSQSPSKRKLNFGSGDGGGRGGSIGGGGQARYFLRNFLSILTDVITDTFHAHLLHPEDHRLVQNFVSLSLDAQHLFVRLFQRKWVWRPVSKLKNKNKELPDDLTPAIGELLNLNFLEQISASNCGSLEEVLDTMDLPKISSFAKKMKLNPAKKTKECLKDALLNIRKSQKTLTGAQGHEGILKHALVELGAAYRVTASSKLAFSRLFLLHAPPQYWEVENDQASNQLLIVLLSQMGQMEYPRYEIQKSTKVYASRDDLIEFHEAFTLHSNLVAYTEMKNWEEVSKHAAEAKVNLQKVLNNPGTQKHDKGLPSFLKIYTAGSVLAHSLWMGVDGYQKLKQWKDANEVINFLLGQTVYLTNYRGRWWERLVINLETHLKRGKEEVKALLEEALKDKYLKENHRLTLTQRLTKVKATLEKKGKGKKKPVVTRKAKPKPKPKKKGGKRGKSQYVDESSEEEEDETPSPPVTMLENTDDLETQVVTFEEEQTEEENTLRTLVLKHEIPTRTITGEKLDQGPGAMGKSIFVSRQDSAGGSRMGSVEQFVIDYYREEHGYHWGLHGEGSTVVTMYGLLFWDVIFTPGIPDAFHHKYQPFPLDLHFEDFYHRRKDLIEEKLLLIRNVLTMEELEAIVDQVWGEQEKKLSIVNWAMFEEGVDRLKSLMRALGRQMIANICQRLATNYRQYCSGFPDLVVWKEEEADYEEEEHDGDEPEGGRGKGKVLFVEVKGPGDHLSEKQQLWLDFLVDSGIPAEVCHVKAVSNKRIRLNR